MPGARARPSSRVSTSVTLLSRNGVRIDSIPLVPASSSCRRGKKARLLGPQVRQQGLLIAVAEGRRREARGLAVENVRGEPEQLGCRRQVGYLVETDQALVIRLKRHHPLALG